MKIFSDTKHANRIFDILIILLCMLVIIPAFVMCKYNVPGASDDFFHGFFLQDKSYWDAVLYWYKSGYNGRFANAMLMQLPGRPFLEPSFGKVFPLITFSLLFISLSYLVRTITRQQKFSRSLMISSILFAFFIAYTPHITQFYWYSGLTVYVLPAIFFFTLLANLIRHFNKKQNIFSVIFTVLSLFFIIGSNENWMLMSLFTILTFVFLSIRKKEKLKFFSYFTIGYALVLSLLIILSPGTTHRLDGEGQAAQNQGFMESATTAIFYTGNFLKNWFIKSWILLAGILLGMLTSRDRKKEDTAFKLPLWYSTLSIPLVIYAGTFIMLFSLGFTNPVRLRGLVPVFFVSTLFTIYTGIIIGRSPLLDKVKSSLGKYGIQIALLFVVFMSISGSVNTKNIYHELNTGSAKKFSEQNEFVVNYIKSSPGDTVIIPPVTAKSSVLYSIEIPKQSKGLTHWIMTSYFKKRVIVADNNKSLEELMQE